MTDAAAPPARCPACGGEPATSGRYCLACGADLGPAGGGDDPPPEADEPKPSADALALGWRRWWRRMAGGP